MNEEVHPSQVTPTGSHHVTGVQPLEGREARCTCGRTVPSSARLAFFEFRGEGSRAARDSCKRCGYMEVAHTQEATRTRRNVVEMGLCTGFEAKGAWEFDSYYCGHAGWD